MLNSSDGDNAPAHSPHHRLPVVGCPKLARCVADMENHRPLGNAEDLQDFPRRLAQARPLQANLLAWRQLWRSGVGRRRVELEQRLVQVDRGQQHLIREHFRVPPGLVRHRIGRRAEQRAIAVETADRNRDTRQQPVLARFVGHAMRSGLPFDHIPVDRQVAAGGRFHDGVDRDVPGFLVTEHPRIGIGIDNALGAEMLGWHHDFVTLEELTGIRRHDQRQIKEIAESQIAEGAMQKCTNLFLRIRRKQHLKRIHRPIHDGFIA